MKKSMHKHRGSTVVQLIVYVLIVVCGLGFALYSLYMNATLGNRASDWEEKCVYGQKVLVANYLAKGFAVNKLTEEGKPVLCSGEEK